MSPPDSAFVVAVVENDYGLVTRLRDQVLVLVGKETCEKGFDFRQIKVKSGGSAEGRQAEEITTDVVALSPKAVVLDLVLTAKDKRDVQTAAALPSGCRVLKQVVERLPETYVVICSRLAKDLAVEQFIDDIRRSSREDTLHIIGKGDLERLARAVVARAKAWKTEKATQAAPQVVVPKKEPSLGEALFYGLSSPVARRKPKR